MLTNLFISIIITATAIIITVAGITIRIPLPFPGNGYGKEQCKDGGWRRLGFRSEKECKDFFKKHKKDR